MAGVRAVVFVRGKIPPSEMIALAEEKGTDSIERAMQPGFSTTPPWVQEMGFSAGMGLPNVQACADEMKSESKMDIGTRLEIVIHTQ